MASVVALLLSVPVLTGFDMSRHSIDPGEILSGGPSKDGIPAIVNPRFVPASEAIFLSPEDVVIGLSSGDTAKAYPLRILNWHEIVNDEIAGEPVAITYCPLTASGVVFERELDGETLIFGVSGLLYQSNVLLYDRQTESLWSQLGEKAVTGPKTGRSLRALPSVATTWADWRTLHPATLVLSPDTGHQRDYQRDPYSGYRTSREPMFPVRHTDDRLAPKTKVFGLQVGGEAKAFPLAALEKRKRVEDEVGGRKVRIDHSPGLGRVSAVSVEEDEPLAGVVVYWFAWATFHPGTEIWQAPPGPEQAISSGAPPTGDAEGSEEVAITEHSAYWTELPLVGSGRDLGAGKPEGVMVIRGEVRNRTASAPPHVTMLFELLDAGRAVVASELGYNYRAEHLRPLDSPLPLNIAPVAILPIPAGGTDTFRMLFLADEISAFETYRVQVMETVPQSEP